MDTVLKCPVTALKITEDVLLSGQGSNLIIHRLSDNSKLISVKVFSSSRVHKFVECQHTPGLWLIVGGKSARCITLCNNNGLYDVAFLDEEKNVKDWVWDAYWITGRSVLFISAHNTVLLWDPFTNNCAVVSSCRQQCILYSATFSMFQNELVVAVGTVFNKVLLWKPSYDVNGNHDYKDVHTTFVGHEGVIFRVRFRESERQMLTVSDDRSIRLWSLIDGSSLHVFYGHVARVWDAQCTTENIVSIGEDAICIVWSLSGNIIKKYSGHKGKSIWSMDIRENEIVTGGGDGAIRIWNMQTEPLEMEGMPLELDLPVDDSVLAKDAKDYPRIVKFTDHTNMIVFSNNGVLWNYFLPSASWTVLHCDESFASYCCLDISANLVAIGNLKGFVKIMDVKNVSCFCKEQLFSGKVLSLFLLTAEREKLLLACGPAGEIKVMSIQMQQSEVSLSELCRFICPHSKQRWIAAVDVVISNYNRSTDICNVSNLLHNIAFICGDRRGSVHVFLAKTKDPVQSILGVHGKTGVTQIKVHKDYIYSTGRDGTFRKYYYNFNEQNLSLIDKQKACKGMDWIEGIWFNNSDMVVYGFYMQNHFATWNYETNELQFKIKCGGGYRSWDIAFPNTDNTDTLCFSYVKGATLNLLSYNWKQSSHGRILQEGLHGREVMAVKVIGKQVLEDSTLWLLATCSEDTTINFVIYDSVNTTLKCLHSAVGHIGGVRDICFVPLNKQSNNGMSGCVFKGLFVSSGSRTSLKLWMLRDNMFTDIKTDIRNPQFPVSHDFSCSLMCEIYTPETKLKKLKLKDHNMIDDMRYMSCDGFFLTDLYPTLRDFDDIFCCACGCSDGVVRVYIFNDSSVDLLTLLNCDKHCVLTVRTFTHILDNKLKISLLGSVTNGVIYVWDITSALENYVENLHKRAFEYDGACNSLKTENDGIEPDIEFDHDIDVKNEIKSPLKSTCEHINQRRYPFHSLNAPLWDIKDRHCVKVSVHQSGVNTVDILQTSDSLLLVSGGDDSCVSVTKLIFNDIDALEIASTYSLKSAHISSISAVVFITETLVASTSIDQRIKFWSIEDGSLLLVYEINTDIADVSNMEIWVSSGVVHVAVTGIGLEIFTIPIEKLTLSFP